MSAPPDRSKVLKRPSGAANAVSLGSIHMGSIVPQGDTGLEGWRRHLPTLQRMRFPQSKFRFAQALGLAWLCLAGPAQGTEAASGPEAKPAAVQVTVPRISGRLHASDLGVVVNLGDPYSVATAAYYQRQRHLSEAQMLRLHIPVKPRLEPQELEALREQIQAHFGPDTQALALVWRQPFAVACQSITAAVSLGFQASFCANTCGAGKNSPLFGNPSHQPWRQSGVRPSMLLAAKDEGEARRLIDRGVAADQTLGALFGPRSRAVFETTGDAARNVRSPLYPPAGAVGGSGVMVLRANGEAAGLTTAADVIAYQTGLAQLRGLEQLSFLPGALADHLTSFGGVLDGTGGQSTALEWISAGATASHGTVSEPCNHRQKFPHPQVLLLSYLQGSTAIEAYWRSVLWPGQGLFVGEPLATPFARR